MAKKPKIKGPRTGPGVPAYAVPPKPIPEPLETPPTAVDARSPGVLLRYPELRNLYLKHLARYGSRTAAARYIRMSTVTVDMFRMRYPWFETQCDEAMDQHRDLIEKTIHTRAIDGVDEPRFGKFGVIGTVKRYSDALLLAYARRWIPEYREGDKTTQVVAGEVVHKHKVDVKELTPEKRAALRLLLGAPEGEEPEEVKPAQVVGLNGTNGHHKNGHA